MRSRATLLRLSATVGLLTYLATRLNWPALAHIFARADVKLMALALFLSPGLVLALAGRLQFLLRVGAVSVPFIWTWRATWAGQFFNTCLPGSTGGDLVRIFELIHQCPQMHARITGLVVFDRLLALLGLVLLATMAVASGRFPWGRVVAGNVELRILLPVTLGVGLGVLAWAWLRREQLALRWPWVSRMSRFMNQMRVEVGTRVLRPSVISIGLALALPVHVANFSLVYLLARSLGLGLSYGQTLALMPVLVLVLMLPVTINGHGLRELILVSYFLWLHGSSADLATGPREQAIALSMVFVANDLICSVPGGLWYLFRRRSSPGPLTSEPVSSHSIA